MRTLEITQKGLKFVSLLGVLGLIQACANNFTFRVEVDNPAPSTEQFVSIDQDNPAHITYVSQLPESQVHAKGTILNYVYQQDKQDIDSADFFLKALDKELSARNLPVSFSENNDDQLVLLSYDTIAHRRNGFSPLVTISMVKLDLMEQGKAHRLAAVVKRAKVPMWTVTEAPLVEATINQPQELLIKEVGAKINMALFNKKLSDESVERLIQEIRTNQRDEDLAYQKVYELGFSNNHKALPALREFAAHNAEYIRLAAISSMGMIGKESALEELKGLYQSGRQWQDRAMALKAIGDIQTPEALAFLKQERERWQQSDSTEADWNNTILALYLD